MPTTHTVDCNAGEKIQDKIAIAKPGDTILVSGDCSENTIKGFTITGGRDGIHLSGVATSA